jgi:NADPH:quinone reductase-like Zn-dependent oxidoreductase
MKANVLTNYGSPEFFKFQEMEKPTPRDNEVLIKVHASSVNSWDWEILMGKPFVNRLMVGLRKPTRIKILGCDIAGRVESIGSKVNRFQPGDEVFGDISHCGWGGFAEFVCVPEKADALALKPAALTFEESAAVPQAGVLALQGLRKGQIQSGQKVLINGAGGGVGSFAVPMAKSFGAEVTGVDSSGKMDFVRSLGADHLIDYTQVDFTREGQQYDLILDVQAYHSISDYRQALSPDGRYIMVGGSSALVNKIFLLGPLISMTEGKKLSLLLHRPRASDLDYLNTLFAAGKCAPVIDKCFALNEVAEAFSYFESGQLKGKIVITMQQET